MDRLRTYRRSGSGLALLALVLQIVLAFGHIHRPAAPTALAGHAAPAGVLADRHPSAPDPLPASDDGDDDGGCAICAAMATLHAFQPSAAPSLPPLTLRVLIERRATSRARLPSAIATAFQPRGPPTA